LNAVRDIQIVTDHKSILNALKTGDKVLSGNFVMKHLSRYKLDKKEIMEKNPEYFVNLNKV